MGSENISAINVIREIIKNRNILILMVTQTLFMFTAFLWWPFRSLFIKEYGVSVELLGQLFMIETIAGILFQLPGGVLADRWGRKRVLVISAFLRLGSPIFFLLGNHWTHFIPGIILGAAGMIGIPAINAIMADSLPSGNRGAGFAAYRTVTSIPVIITSLLGGIITDYFGVIPGCKYILSASVITATVSLLMRWRFIEETFVPAERTEENPIIDIKEGLKKMPRDLWVLTAVMGFSVFAMRLMVSFMVIYGTEVVGLSKTQWGLIGTIVSIITTLLTTPAGMMADKIGKKRIIIASRTLNSFSVLGYTFSYNFIHMLVVRSLAGIGNGLGGAMMGPMGGPVWQALVADLSPQEDRGRIMGFMGTIGSIASSPASWVGGYLYDNISPNVPFQASFILDTVGTLILILFLRESVESSQKPKNITR